MNEQETIIVSAAKEEYQDNPNSCVGELLIIIDCLDGQLTNLVEAGEPFRKAGEQIGANYPDFYGITVTHPKDGMDLCVGDFRRHAQALKEVRGDTDERRI